jgi:hypothetical protein
MSAPTFNQVKGILWRELSTWYPMLQDSLGGPDLPKDPATGVELPGGRQIMGLAVAKPENLAGISGSELLFIVDEASGFDDDIFQAILGNAAGGAKIIGISNPTRTVGWFFEGFKKGTYDLRPSADSGVPAHRWRLLHISSEYAAQRQAANDNAIPGIATWAWVEEWRDWIGDGYEEEAEYLVRVLGAFPEQATDAVIGYKFVRQAMERWAPNAESQGELTLGVDVARMGDDETVIQPVRGLFAWPATVLSDADGPTVAEEVVRVGLSLRGHKERVRVALDSIGVGASVYDALVRHPEVQAKRLYIVPINVGEASDDGHHHNLRSQIWFNMREWLRAGGMLPEDEQLASELVAPTYTFDVYNRKKVQRKEDVRKFIKRSPDRADALALGTYRGHAIEYDYQRVEPAERQGFHPMNHDDDDDDFGKAGGIL